MPSLTVKNVPPELLDRLRASARRNRRSMTSELIVQLERALGDQAVDSTQDVFALLETSDRVLRDAGVYLTDDKLEGMITDGRA